MHRFTLCFAITFGFATCMTSQSRADEDSQKGKTTITIEELACDCAVMAVTRMLTEITEVDKVKVDLKSKTAVVTPKAKATLSPIKLWEAIIEAGEKPVKLVGPSGTFTSKPRK